MPNKNYNKQVTYSVAGSSSKGKGAKGAALSSSMGTHTSPAPGVGGPTKKWPEKSGWRVASPYPVADGME